MTALLLLLALPSASRPDAAVAIFDDPTFPYFAAGTGLTPPDVAFHLREIGLDAELLSADDLAADLNAEHYCALVSLYGNTFPLNAGDSIQQFHAAGGGLISVGVPYCHPCERVGANGWQFLQADSDHVSRGSDGAHSGRVSLCVGKDSTPGWTGACSDRVPAEPGVGYTVSGWVRTEGRVGADERDTLFLRFFGEGGNFLGQWGPSFPEAAEDWTEIALEMTAPPGAVEMDVCPALWGSPGTLWLDDAAVTAAGNRENLMPGGGFEEPGGEWVDLGHVQEWLTHDHIGSGGFHTSSPERGALRYQVGADPLQLGLIGWDRRTEAWREGFVDSQALDPSSLPDEDEVVSIVDYPDGGQNWPVVAAIHHHCPQFDGAVDVWAGATLFTALGLYAPIDQREVIARAVVYIAHETGRLADDAREAILARADAAYLRDAPPTDIDVVREPKPFEGLYPKCPRPAPELFVAEVRYAPRDVQFLLASLQGLVNRKRPRIYLNLNPAYADPQPDDRWLTWLRERGDVQSVRQVDEPLDLLKRFRSAYKGLVVVDPQVPATVNVATMVAGVEDLLIASPELAEKLDVPVREDLRGRWQTNADAMAWAAQELWPKLNHHVFGCAHPDLPHLRDYLVAHKVFTFWVTGPLDGPPPAGGPVREQAVVESVLAKAPPNVGCIGAPYQGVGVGFSEGPGVSMLSRYGKFLSWSNTNANLSVHSGTVPRAPLRHKPAPCPPLEQDKVYITMMVSDGDAPVNWYQFFPAFYWDDPLRGTFPLTWSVGPGVYDLVPDLMDYYYSRANENDCFVAACSGAGYCYPDVFGSQYADQAGVFSDYLKLTDMAMQPLDLRGIWTHTTTGERLEALARDVPMVSYLLPDYSRAATTTAANANRLAASDVPAFHALTSFNMNLGEAATMQLMLDDIAKYTPAERPAFMHVFVQCYPWTPTKLRAMLDALGPEYVPVRADHLAELYLQASRRSGL